MPSAHVAAIMKIIRLLSSADAPGTCLYTVADQSLYFGFSFSSALTRSRVVGVNCLYAIYATVMCPRSFHASAGPLNANPNAAHRRTFSAFAVNCINPPILAEQ